MEKEKSIWQYGAYKNWEVLVFVSVFFTIGILVGISFMK